jgi:phospholipid transport system transporter-binding protein
MTENTQFQIESSGQASISGPLTLDTVSAVFAQAGDAAARGNYIIQIDLSEVSRVDSSGLALLLEWQSLARNRGDSIKIHNAPADLQSLASLCEAGELLHIEGRLKGGETPTNEKEASPEF